MTSFAPIIEFDIFGLVPSFNLLQLEAGIMTAQIEVGRTEWGFRPLMWQYCAEQTDKEIYEIIEMKNKNKDCKAFHKQEPIRPTECMKCKYRNRPPDRYRKATAGVLDTKIFNDIVNAIEKDHELEVTSGWIHRGMLPSEPAFQDWCSYYSEGGRFALCAYMNVHGVCPNYEPLGPEFDIHKV